MCLDMVKMYEVKYVSILLIVGISVCIVDVSCTSLCKPGQYFDVHFERCDWCSTVCDEAEIQNTVDKCQKHCPDYDKAAQGSVLTQNGTTPTPRASLLLGLSPWAIAGIVLMGLCGIATSVTLIIFRDKVMTLVKKRLCRCCVRRPVQEEQQPEPSVLLMVDGGENDHLETC